MPELECPTAVVWQKYCLAVVGIVNLYELWSLLFDHRWAEALLNRSVPLLLSERIQRKPENHDK